MINYKYLKSNDDLKVVVEGTDHNFHYFDVIDLGIRNDVIEVAVGYGDIKKVICSVAQKFVTKTGPKCLYKIINDKDEVLTHSGEFLPITHNVCLKPDHMCDIKIFGSDAYFYNDVALVA